MFFVFYIMPYFLLLTDASHSTRDGMGPPCYGRSDCVNPFTENADNVTEPTTSNATPKRYIKVEEFKSPIFGSYKYDPLLGDFVIPDSSTSRGGEGGTERSEIVMMRAAEEESKSSNDPQLTTTEEISKNRSKERKNRRRNMNAISQW